MIPVTKEVLATQLYKNLLDWMKDNSITLEDIKEDQKDFPVTFRSMRALKAGSLVFRPSKVKSICQFIGMEFEHTETFFINFAE